MRWFETPNYNFTSMYKVSYAVSGFLVIISVIAIFTMGLNYGIDFRGGQEFVFEFDQPVDVVELRSELTEPLQSTPEIKLFGSDREILLRVDTEENITQTRELLLSSFQEIYPGVSVSVQKTDLVGPRFAEDLRRGALYSILFSIFVIFVYLLIRFKGWNYSTGAVVGLVHDVVIILGIFTILRDIAPFDVSIDQTLIAGFLTIVGYSLNDTVVVFDRVRENSLIYKTMEYTELVNKSLNDTLSRTVITSLTTLFVVVVLFIFGGEVLKGFAFALILGIILGTYSTLFIATAVAVDLKKRFTEKKA
ncbi:MAG TPA: protein translocase subunit SecF [Balneolaceae bacterium]|nr:protein translocase subunit SecF [Balneolaceae bacterium]